MTCRHVTCVTLAAIYNNFDAYCCLELEILSKFRSPLTHCRKTILSRGYNAFPLQLLPDLLGHERSWHEIDLFVVFRPDQ